MKHDFEIEFRPPEGKEVCDFCSSPQIFKAYDCPTFATGLSAQVPRQSPDLPALTVHSMSKGGWAACGICAALIDGDKWSELTERSVATLLIKEPELRPFKEKVRKSMAWMHQQFRALKKLPN
jgi:hypothetical protein